MMRYSLSLLFYSFFLSLWSVPHPAYAVLWNKVLAVYNKNVLTFWDVQREIQVDRIKRGKPFEGAISIDDLKVMTKKMIVESLVVMEAESFNIGKLSQDDFSREIKKFRNKFKSEAHYQAFLKQYHWGEGELEAVLTRTLLAERFIKEKILSAYVYISDEEISAYQSKHQGVTRKEAENLLRKKRVYDNFRLWIQSLKLRNEIRTIWE